MLKQLFIASLWFRFLIGFSIVALLYLIVGLPLENGPTLGISVMLGYLVGLIVVFIGPERGRKKPKIRNYH